MNLIVINEDQFNQITGKLDTIYQKLEERFESQKAWLSTQEAMELLNIGQTTLWNYRNQGKIKARNIGRKCYYKRSDIEELIEGNHK